MDAYLVFEDLRLLSPHLFLLVGKKEKRKRGENQYASIVPILRKSLQTDGISVSKGHSNFIASNYLSGTNEAI